MVQGMSICSLVSLAPRHFMVGSNAPRTPAPRLPCCWVFWIQRTITPAPLVGNAKMYLWARLATWEEMAVIMGQRAAPVIMQCPEGLPAREARSLW